MKQDDIHVRAASTKDASAQTAAVSHLTRETAAFYSSISLWIIKS